MSWRVLITSSMPREMQTLTNEDWRFTVSVTGKDSYSILDGLSLLRTHSGFSNSHTTWWSLLHSYTHTLSLVSLLLSFLHPQPMPLPWSWRAHIHTLLVQYTLVFHHSRRNLHNLLHGVGFTTVLQISPSGIFYALQFWKYKLIFSMNRDRSMLDRSI